MVSALRCFVFVARWCCPYACSSRLWAKKATPPTECCPLRRREWMVKEAFESSGSHPARLSEPGWPPQVPRRGSDTPRRLSAAECAPASPEIRVGIFARAPPLGVSSVRRLGRHVSCGPLLLSHAVEQHESGTSCVTGMGDQSALAAKHPVIRERAVALARVWQCSRLTLPVSADPCRVIHCLAHGRSDSEILIGLVVGANPPPASAQPCATKQVLVRRSRQAWQAGRGRQGPAAPLPRHTACP